MSVLDKEEQDILDAFDAGELQRASDFEERKARHQQYAEAMFKKEAASTSGLPGVNFKTNRGKHQ